MKTCCSKCYKRAKYRWGADCYCFSHYWEARRASRTTVSISIPQEVELPAEAGSVVYGAITDGAIVYGVDNPEPVKVQIADTDRPKRRYRRKAKDTAIDGEVSNATVSPAEKNTETTQ